MNALIKVAALAAVVSIPAAFAQDDPSTPAQPGAQAVDYSKLDTNDDGKISKDEAAADSMLSSKFSTLDKDGDGSLSSTELSVAKPKM
jgi:hypothetical protein